MDTHMDMHTHARSSTHMSAVVVGELLLKVHKANNACHKKVE